MRPTILALALTIGCGAPADSASADSGAPAPIPAGPTLAHIDLIGEQMAIEGIEAPGPIVSVVACTDPESGAECEPVGWSVIDGRLYVRAGHPAWRVWFLQ